MRRTSIGRWKTSNYNNLTNSTTISNNLHHRRRNRRSLISCLKLVNTSKARANNDTQSIQCHRHRHRLSHKHKDQQIRRLSKLMPIIRVTMLPLLLHPHPIHPRLTSTTLTHIHIITTTITIIMVQRRHRTHPCPPQTLLSLLHLLLLWRLALRCLLPPRQRRRHLNFAFSLHSLIATSPSVMREILFNSVINDNSIVSLSYMKYMIGMPRPSATFATQ